MRRRRNKDLKNFIIALIFLAVVFMTAGYAAYSRELTINGTGRILNDFNVIFEDIDVLGRFGMAESTGHEIVDDAMITLAANFYLPGDSITYVIEISNESELFDAELDKIEWIYPGIALADRFITWEIEGIDEGDIILASPSTNRLVRITATLDATRIAANDDELPDGVTNDEDDTYSEEVTIRFHFIPA